MKLDLVITPFAKENIQILAVPGVTTHRWSMLLPGTGGVLVLQFQVESLEKARGSSIEQLRTIKTVFLNSSCSFAQVCV